MDGMFIFLVKLSATSWNFFNFVPTILFYLRSLQGFIRASTTLKIPVGTESKAFLTITQLVGSSAQKFVVWVEEAFLDDEHSLCDKDHHMKAGRGIGDGSLPCKVIFGSLLVDLRLLNAAQKLEVEIVRIVV